MSISSTASKVKSKVEDNNRILIEDKLLYVLQQTYSVNESYQIMRAIFSINTSFEDLEDMISDINTDVDEDFEEWYNDDEE